jgi:ribosomal protein S1
MNMQTQIGNEELAYLFEQDDRLGNKKAMAARRQTKEYKEMAYLYDSVEVNFPTKGEVVSAEYVGGNSENFVFEVSGYKDYVRVDNRNQEAKYLKNTEVGEVIDLLIVEVNNTNFLIRGSIANLYESRAHAHMKSLAEGAPVIGIIKSLNPAGYDVEIHMGGVTLPGFMPNTLAGINKLHDPNSIVGTELEVAIESYSEQEGTYIVSRRKYLQSLIPAAIKELEYNKVYTGHVTGTLPFGVFVEFEGCLTGMIHKANVHPEWQEKLDEIKPGFEIEFYIKEIVRNNKGDVKRDKIILTQILRETLWDTIKNGQVIEGKVKDTKQFGTLVHLDEETIGLIHTSEMEKLGKKFTAGQDVKVKVLSVDRNSRKIFLTLG